MLYQQTIFKSLLAIFPRRFSSVQLLSPVQLFVTPWTVAHEASLSTPIPGAYSNSCPSSGDAIQQSHPLLSPSAPALNLPSIRVFLNATGGQSIGVSASESVLPTNIQGWFPLAWTSWISLQSTGLSRVFSNTTAKSIKSSALSFLYSPTLTSIHDYRKDHSFD